MKIRVALLLVFCFFAGMESRQQLFENMLSDEPAVLTEFKENDKFDFDKIRGFIKLYNKTAAAHM